MTTILVPIGAFLFLLLIIHNWIISSEPRLPSNINILIQEIIDGDLPELLPGQSGLAKNGNIKIAYEILEGQNCKDINILLINGLSQTLLEWPSYFYNPLLEAGYRVIRYDNRGVGESDWMLNWGENNKYTLNEMATDGIAILNHLEIDKAHIIGS